ncbi:MAG: response regulator [Leptolyngbyaceae cyanobacterium MO_188.B28]|nr:response regulator [Leptolyngbyaceae cyanobacterium MO_188.B28]
MLQFQAEQLSEAILNLQKDKFSGIGYIENIADSEGLKKPRILVFRNGEITYGGLYLPEPQALSKKLGGHFKLQVMDSAYQLASKKIEDPTSIRKYLELYIRLELFTWQDVETFMRNQVVLILEQLLPYPGTLKFNASVSMDLSYGEDGHGFTWEQLKQNIVQRRRVWASLAPAIPSMNVIPQRIEAAQTTITDVWVQQHLKQCADGQQSLVDIANQMGRDPLEVAHIYLHFMQMGWVAFSQDEYTPTFNHSANGAAVAKPELPTILSVDDSPVVQTMIKRSIGDRYHVLLANNAIDALNLLNSKKIELLLLDVTMPDIDGLELCRTIRNISKFRNLPIIMLTAKDGMLNKFKGQMAGSTQYLTKPVDRQKLLEVLEKYIPTSVMA